MNKPANNLPKRYSWKFWLIFWLIAILALFGWYVFLQIKNKNIQSLKPLLKIAPIGNERRNELQVLADIYQKMGGFSPAGGQVTGEKTFLILFQNDMELRPGGGFLGSFGIVKVNRGKISDLQVHDTGVFDGRIPDVETPPYPMGETFHIKGWKLRDSNWSPDFAANAEKAEYFYKLGEGTENFDGVIAVNTNVLNSLLSITGPVKIDEYPGEYNNETAILQLEYQVEKGFAEQGIEKGERKNIMKELAAILAEKVHNFSLSQQLELAKEIEKHLKQKDIQLFFKDTELQAEVDNMNWSGKVRDSGGDYLMIVDANLNSLKSDLCIRRSIDYTIDFHGDFPQATLQIIYEHTCRTRDWMTTNYNDWLRVYAPAETWYEGGEVKNGEVKFGQELGKNVFAHSVYVPVGETKTVVMKYNFPKDFQKDAYSLMVQKQSGSGELPVKIKVRKANGKLESINDVLVSDKNFSL